VATNYDINYEDQRFKDVEADKKDAINEIDKTYGDMISQSDAYYDKQIEASKQWEEKQSQLQQEQTDFAIDKIEQQREQAKKDYIKEQSGAYGDWQKQSNPYGVNAEQMAANGMTNTGFSESSQVSMWNTYQNRVTAARELMAQANINFDNGIREAQLQNSSVLAEIHFNAYKEQLALSLQGFQYKNQLLLEMADKKTEANNTYYARYQDVLAQINHENALKEEVRQADRAYALQQQELQLAQAKFNYQKQQDVAAKAAASAAAKVRSAVKKATKAATSAAKNVASGKVNKTSTEPVTNSVSAEEYLNNLIASGASKDKVSNEIAIALREGAITKEEAAKLRQTFTPRGVQY